MFRTSPRSQYIRISAKYASGAICSPSIFKSSKLKAYFNNFNNGLFCMSVRLSNFGRMTKSNLLNAMCPTWEFALIRNPPCRLCSIISTIFVFVLSFHKWELGGGIPINLPLPNQRKQNRVYPLFCNGKPVLHVHRVKNLMPISQRHKDLRLRLRHCRRCSGFQRFDLFL